MTEVVARRSRFGFDDTVRRLRSRIAALGATVFAVIDHAANAEAAGLRLPPTTVVVFGNPAVGTPLMMEHPDLALDLPSRVLVRQVGDSVEVAYIDPRVLAARHGLTGKEEAGLSGLIRIVEDAIGS